MIGNIIHGGGAGHKIPLLIFTVVIIGLLVKKIIDIFIKKNLNRTRLESGLNAILFWGCISALFGIFDHYFGLFQAVNSIAPGAKRISPSIVVFGYAASLISIFWGLLNLLIAAIFWYIFRWKINKLTLTENKKLKGDYHV